jgi:hypothetical protein
MRAVGEGEEGQQRPLILCGGIRAIADSNPGFHLGAPAERSDWVCNKPMTDGTDRA